MKNEKMEKILKELEDINVWKSYDDIIPFLRRIIDTEEFKKFPKLKNNYFIEALSLYGLEKWDSLPIHSKALIISRYPIFINKLAFGKTLEEYNQDKTKIFNELSAMGLPICPIFQLQSEEIKNTIAKWQYLSFFRNSSDSNPQTALSLDRCKEIANAAGKGLIVIFLTFNLSEDLLSSIVVYNQVSRTNKLVDSSVINRTKLIAETNPKVSEKEFEILIDREECFVCLDYGLCGLYSISHHSIPKKFILENRALSCCPNDFILENMKISFLHDFNSKGLVVNGFQDELKKVGDIISETWDDDKNKFVENIQYLKTENYPLYLYLYWIKNDESIHTRYQAFVYAQEWVQSSE